MTIRNISRWAAPSSGSPDHILLQAIGGHPLVSRILAQRGHTTPEAARAFLSPVYYSPTLPEALPDLAKAAEALENSVNNQDTVLV